MGGIKRHFQVDFDRYRLSFPTFFAPNKDPRISQDWKDGMVPLHDFTFRSASSDAGIKALNGRRRKIIEDYIAEDVEEEPNADAVEEMGEGEKPTGEEIEIFGGHPGGVVEGMVTNAFYLPFHMYWRYWGIYIYPDGIRRKNRELKKWYQRHGHQFPACLNHWEFGLTYLINHEVYHHRCESFGTRLETITTYPWYLAFSDRYKQVVMTDDCYEEACANCNARETTVKDYGKLFPKDKGRKMKNLLRRAINEKVSSDLPGYKLSREHGADWELTARPGLFEDYLDHPDQSNPRPTTRGLLVGEARQAAWLLSNYVDSGICPYKGMTYYLVKPGTSLHNRIKAIT